MNASGAERTFVLGLDGIPWDLLSTWVTDGKLPHFNELLENGASGPLKSTIPPTTALAWPSIATGARADKHGIYSFRNLTEEYTHEMNTSNNVKQPRLWDILSPSVVANVPMTYPAREIDGKMVTGMMTPSIDEGFTYPPELANEITSEIPEYEIGLSWQEYHDREEEFLEDFSDLLAARRKLMRHLMEVEEWELFFFVYTEPDRLQHLIWDEDVILEHYKELDDILGEVMTFVSENDANLFVVSDHGFGPISKFVHVNTILEENGLLQRKDNSGIRAAFSTLGISKTSIQSILRKSGLQKPLLRIIPDSIINNVANAVPGQHSLFDIDYTNTEAFGYAKRNIYVNDTNRFVHGPVDSSDIPDIKSEIEKVFQDIRDPESNKKLLEVYDGDKLFPSDNDSPDLVVKGVNGAEENTNLSDSVIEKSDKKSGAHLSQGIFFAWGPNIQEDTEVSGASVYDLAPTLLHSLSKPVPTTADGNCLDIFEASSESALNDVEYKDYKTESGYHEQSSDFEEVEERLEGLGYI